MRNVKYILNDNDLYDFQRIQEELTRRAAEGWHLEKVTHFLWKFRRGEPKAVRYEIICTASGSEYNSQPTEEEKDLADFCAEAGWELAAAVAGVQIYRTEAPGAPSLETDEVQKFRNIRRAMQKHLFPQLWGRIALFAVQLLIYGSRSIREPASMLSSSMMLFLLAGCTGIVLENGFQLAAVLRWLRRAGRAVEAGLPIPPNLCFRRFRWVRWGSLALYLLGLLYAGGPGIVLAVLILVPVAAVTSLVTLAVTKRLHASRNVNIWAPALVTMAVILLSRPLISPLLTTEEKPVEFPLTLNQLTGENGDRLTIGVDSSPLVSYGRYYDFGPVNQIQYTVADVHCPLFYDMIRSDLEQKLFQSAGYRGNTTLPDGLQESLATDYLCRNTGASEDRWLLCWEDRIVYLYANWSLTDEQLSAIAEILNP